MPYAFKQYNIMILNHKSKYAVVTPSRHAVWKQAQRAGFVYSSWCFLCGLDDYPHWIRYESETDNATGIPIRIDLVNSLAEFIEETTDPSALNDIRSVSG